MKYDTNVKELFLYLTDYIQTCPIKLINTIENQSENRYGVATFQQGNEVFLTINYVTDVDQYVVMKMVLNKNHHMVTFSSDKLYALCNSDNSTYNKQVKKFLSVLGAEIKALISQRLETEIGQSWEYMNPK